MDRDRLKGVQQTDLTESRVNQEFVFWLKEKGVNYLLVVVLAACGAVLWMNWRQRAANARDDAWIEFAGASTPAALTEVASKHADVDSIPLLARLELADLYLNSIQTGRRFDRDANAPDFKVTPELREQWLGEADRLYREVIETVGPTPKEFARKIFSVNALFGRAAIAESQGRFDDAKRFLEDAAAAARPEYTGLQEEAQKRIDSLAWLAKTPALPLNAEVPPDPEPQAAPPALIDEIVNSPAEQSPTPGLANPFQPGAEPAPSDEPGEGEQLFGEGAELPF